MDTLNMNISDINGLLLSSNASPIIPYLVIVFAAATGASWSLRRKEGLTKWGSALFIIRMVCTAMVLTLAAVKAITLYQPQINEDWVIAPVALLIGMIGDDWLKAYDWALGMVKKAANAFANKKLNDRDS